jgi:hypothetical protein
MKKLGLFSVVMVFIFSAIVAVAQTTGNSEPGFTLSISVFHRGGVPPNTHTIVVKTTNISNVTSCETISANFHWNFKISVLLDGLPIEERPEIQKIRKEQGRPNGFGSFHELRCTKPGATERDEIEITGFYDMSRPGTYDVTLSRETDPKHPDQSITVKSNTITIVVP